jgi:oxygen-independent coproporphyrinogen III oxidase
MPFHLYFHLPYCRRRCPYCDFYKKVPQHGEIARFLPTLLAELALAAESGSEFTGPARTVYFGGGTPSLHSPGEIIAVLEKTGTLWGIEGAAEVTLEANPATLDAAGMSRLRAAGINRLSLGGQSFSARKLAVLYRDHDAAEVDCALADARAAGFTNLSLDLIFGLPDESSEEWGNDLQRALDRRPEHISLYNLEYHEATPLFRWREQQRITALSADLEFDLYLLAHDTLTAAGYEHYEVSNFALPGFRSRHNSAYWTGAPYLGLGPSAHSFDGARRRWANVADVDAWRARVEAGELPIEREWQSTPREQREEWLSLALRRSDGLTFEAAVTQLGSATAAAVWSRARQLPEDSRVISSDNFALTARGWFRENSILLYLFEAL